MKKCLSTVMALAVVASLLAGCENRRTLLRVSAPVVLTGEQLPSLLGTGLIHIHGFAYREVDGEPTWTQIPVQIDQRKVVPFGAIPPTNATPGVTGSVYGLDPTTSPVPSALQYADPDTWVGADPDPGFDEDDELVFMAEDAGDRVPDGVDTEPPWVESGSGVEVQLDDPLVDGGRAWMYLFVSTAYDPAADRDYVHYDWDLHSGSYKGTYRRAFGPNPESSSVITDAYRVGFTDRWFETDWQITAGGATGVDILDGNKNQFGLGVCGRSNATFAAEEGAFVANIDGPIRVIRSYVGANSGPNTQRTHILYANHEVITTDLRVHAIPGVMDFIDYSSGALGMTYLSSEVPGGVTIDRVADAVGTAVPEWELVTGPQGSVVHTARVRSEIPGLENLAQWFYRDEAVPAQTPCWGDTHDTGAHGLWMNGGIPNTEWNALSLDRTVYFAPPGVTAEIAAAYAAQVDAPLEVTVTPYPR